MMNSSRLKTFIPNFAKKKRWGRGGGVEQPIQINKLLN